MNRMLNTGIFVRRAAWAALAVAGLSLPAVAQFPAGQDGHANDANNRVGSNGYNDARQGTGVTANDIVNRNVTGGREFRGPIGEKDPRAFTGPTAGRLNDIFVRQSNGVPTDYGAPESDLSQPRPFYGDSRFTNPPNGSRPVGFNGGYIGTTLSTPSSLSNGLNTEMTLGLQTRTLNRDTLELNQSLSNSQGFPQTLNSTALSNNIANMPSELLTLPNGGQIFPTLDLTERSNLDPQTVFRMRQELLDSAKTPQNQLTPANQPNNLQQPQSLNQPLNSSLNRPIDAPLDAAISSRLNAAALNNGEVSSTGIVSSQSTLVPPTEQSTLLKTLQQRLADSGDIGKALANARPNKIATPKPNNGSVASTNTEGPVQVSTLATGIKAKGLRDLLAGAEDLMRQGKYDSAIQKYNESQRVAPNNPLVMLGRANAELAGGYYGRAEQDLRAVFRSDPELLLAQFDLPSMLSKERVAYIRQDLTQLALADPKAERPWFLLAYFDYNSGDAPGAQKALDEADQRTNRADWAVRLFRSHWALPSNQNKPGETARPSAVPANRELNK